MKHSALRTVLYLVISFAISTAQNLSREQCRTLERVLRDFDIGNAYKLSFRIRLTLTLTMLFGFMLYIAVNCVNSRRRRGRFQSHHISLVAASIVVFGGLTAALVMRLQTPNYLLYKLGITEKTMQSQAQSCSSTLGNMVKRLSGKDRRKILNEGKLSITFIIGHFMFGIIIFFDIIVTAFRSCCKIEDDDSSTASNEDRLRGQRRYGRNNQANINLSMLWHSDPRERSRVGGQCVPRLPESIKGSRDDVCVICLGEMENVQLIELNCKHAFHSNCISKWVMREAGQTCPLCKAPVDQERSTSQEVLPTPPPANVPEEAPDVATEQSPQPLQRS